MQNATALSPETTAALERLNALPAHLVPDHLRGSILDSAAAQAAHRQHSAEVSAVSLAATTAGQLGDVSSAAIAASRLAGLALVGGHLPSTELDGAAVTEALQNARELVRLARGAVPPVVDVEYTLELAGWFSLGGLGVHITGSVPESLGSDLAARAAYDQISADQKSLDAGIAVNRGQAEVLGLLAAAASLIQQCAELAQRTAAVNAVVRQANVARRAAGLSWRAPDSYSSPACAALKKFRAAESALEVPT